MEKFKTSLDAINSLKPTNPLYLFRKEPIAKCANFFLKYFKGDILYAVKTNPDLFTLKELYKNGIKKFDVASVAEIKLIKENFPDANLYFMHPVKSLEAIKQAYFTHGVTDFSLDCKKELEKILEVTDNAKDLNLYVRVAIPNSYAELDLSNKFGILPIEAIKLLKKARKAAKRLGICFHVGSQAMHPDAYVQAIKLVSDLIETADIKIDMLDIGGGFPSIYPGMHPPLLSEYFEAIETAFHNIRGHENIQLMCEPGRALVAESGALIVQVDLRKKDKLYINDGTYGSLFDAGSPEFIFPVKLLRESSSKNFMPFSFYGPTCDSMDFMKGPFYLPKEINTGDYIEIGQLGAYARTMRTNFNGFFSDQMAEITDKPILSLFDFEEHKQTYLKVA